MSILSPQIEVVGPGAISQANDGVLERVAERRLANGWGLTDSKLNTLVAAQDCQLLGRHGWLITDADWVAITVIDCEADAHEGWMKENGLLLDIAGRDDLVHKLGWLLFIK